MARPSYNFKEIDERSKSCYDHIENVGQELRVLASRAGSGAAPNRPMDNVDTLVTKINTLRSASTLAAPTVLFVDPDAKNRKDFEEVFQADFHVITLADNTDALELIKHRQVDILISDLKLCKEVKQNYPTIVRGLVSKYSEEAAANHDAQIRCFIPKPWLHERGAKLLRDVLLSASDATLVG